MFDERSEDNLFGGIAHVAVGEVALPLLERGDALLRITYTRCVGVGWEVRRSLPLGILRGNAILNRTHRECGVLSRKSSGSDHECQKSSHGFVLSTGAEILEGGLLLCFFNLWRRFQMIPSPPMKARLLFRSRHRKLIRRDCERSRRFNRMNFLQQAFMYQYLAEICRIKSRKHRW